MGRYKIFGSYGGKIKKALHKISCPSRSEICVNMMISDVMESPFAARIIIVGDWTCDPIGARNIISKVVDYWIDRGYPRVKYLTTPGGFVHFRWPSVLNPYSEEGFRLIVKEAIMAINQTLPPNLLEKLREITDYITLGIDSESVPGNLRRPHVELVTIVDVRTGKIDWTGKSYPIVEQERGLIRAPVDTHFKNLDGDSVLVLGCHDMNAFNPRAHATAKKQMRIATQRKFIDLVKAHKPQTVLHHPHTTDTSRIWLNGLNFLRRKLGIKRYISAFRYYNGDASPRERLDVVLSNLRIGSTMDIILFKSS